MNCLDFEKLIALDIEGDLPELKAEKLGAHLKACRNCREFKDELRASQAMLKSLAEESAEEAVLEEVRGRVLEGIAAEAKPPRFLAWRFAVGAALVTTAIVAAVTLWRPRTPLQVARISQPPMQEHPDVGTRQRGQDGGATASETPAPQRGGEKQASPEVTRAASKASERPPARTEKAEHVVRRQKQSQAPLAAHLEPPQPEPLTVKFMTDDPNVVIYWQVD